MNEAPRDQQLRPLRWVSGPALILGCILAMHCLADQPRFTAFPSWVGAVAYSADGKSLAVGAGDGITRVLASTNGEEIAVCSRHADAVTAVAFIPNGERVVTGSLDHTARIWEVQSGHLRRTVRGHRGAVMSLAVSSDGQRLVTASIDASIKLWDARTGELRATFSEHKSWVNSVVFSADGKQLFSGSSDGTVKIWDIAGARVLSTLEANTTDQLTPAEVRSVAISPDGQTIAAGLRYGWVKIWTGAGWNKSFSFKGHAGDVWAIGFHPKSAAIITGDGDWNRPGQLKFWDPKTRALLAALATSGEVLALACSPQGREVAAGCWNKHLEVWDVPDVKRSPE